MMENGTIENANEITISEKTSDIRMNGIRIKGGS